MFFQRIEYSDAKNLNSTITFDGNGNPSSVGGNALTWNVNDKITAVGTILTAGYSANGLRAWKQNSTARTYFLYDGLIPVCELDGSGNVTAYNTVGANGLLARHVNGTGGGSVFYCFDPQGSVSVRVDSSGSVLSTHCNEAWGTQVSTGTGYASDPYAGYGGQWGYYRDSETGLHLLGHRYYDVASGRFLNRDPAGYGGGINLYAYCGSSPVRGIDPSGLQALEILEEAAEKIGTNPVAAEEANEILQAASNEAGEICHSISQTFSHEFSNDLSPALSVPFDPLLQSPSVGEQSLIMGGMLTPSGPKCPSKYSQLFIPGPYASDYVVWPDETSRKWELGLISLITDIGQEYGCHTCGSKDPGTAKGLFIPDHQPINAFNLGNDPAALFPHCQKCSNLQGGCVNGLKRAGVF